MQITGNITLVQEDGSVQYANHLSLCRCGHSGTKPTCDGQHIDKEFINPGKISEASEIAASAPATDTTDVEATEVAPADSEATSDGAEADPTEDATEPTTEATEETSSN